MLFVKACLLLLVIDIIEESIATSSNMTKVQVAQGWLEGEELETVTKDSKYYSFKGIPYAEPPVGKLRFKAPEPPKPWEGIRQATEHGPICPQIDISSNKLGEEDCLYLNVYTPDLNPKVLLPVMFFIHGGGFNTGSGNVDYYGPDFLVQHDVVLVTHNYRLDSLGFLCLDTKEVPGNAGLKDQVAALKWVYENIANFGGDPNKITIFGESVGGTSVALHISSPMSKGLFKRAISMSGVPNIDWAISFESRRRAFKLGRQLGIDTEDPAVLLEYLQSLPVDKLIDNKPYILTLEEKSDHLLKTYLFLPVAEKNFGEQHFMIEEPSETHYKGNVNEIDLLIGCTNEETSLDIPTFKKYLLRDYYTYPELLIPRKLFLNIPPKATLDIADKIKKHYFGSKPISVEAMREFLTYANDASFFYPINTFIRQLKNSKAKRYLYEFSCVSNRNVYTSANKDYDINGASHLEDLMYLFDAKVFNLTVDKQSYENKCVNNFCAIVTNFAKYGTPTPDLSLGVNWPEYNNDTKSYVDIRDALIVKHGAGDEICEFWDEIYRNAGVKP